MISYIFIGVCFYFNVFLVINISKGIFRVFGWDDGRGVGWRGEVR